jgi:serine/threonine-protein kinase HipA
MIQSISTLSSQKLRDSAMTRELIALLAGKRLATSQRDAHGRLSFSYNDEWRQEPNANPLPLSMPLAAKEHRRSAIEAFLWGLLPDNERVLERWAAKLQVSARNVLRPSRMLAKTAPAPSNS